VEKAGTVGSEIFKPRIYSKLHGYQFIVALLKNGTKKRKNRWFARTPAGSIITRLGNSAER